MKKIICLCFMLLLLTGCFGGKETTTVCKSLMYMNLTIEAEGDEIVKMFMTEEADLNSLGFTNNDSEEEIRAFIELNLKAYVVDGMTAEIDEIDWDSGMVYVLYEIDMSETDFKDLEKLGLIELEDGALEYISLKQTLDNLKSQGYSCSEE